MINQNNEQPSIYFSHTFTMILMNGNECILNYNPIPTPLHHPPPPKKREKNKTSENSDLIYKHLFCF